MDRDQRLQEAIEFAKHDPTQMDIYDCIVEAQKDTTMTSKPTPRLVKERSQVKLSELTPVQRARMRRAATMLANGEHKIGYECCRCHSESIHVERDPDGDVIAHCLTCGGRVPMREAKALRQRRMREFIAAGMDLPEMQRGTR